VHLGEEGQRREGWSSHLLLGCSGPGSSRACRLRTARKIALPKHAGLRYRPSSFSGTRDAAPGNGEQLGAAPRTTERGTACPPSIAELCCVLEFAGTRRYPPSWVEARILPGACGFGSATPGRASQRGFVGPGAGPCPAPGDRPPALAPAPGLAFPCAFASMSGAASSITLSPSSNALFLPLPSSLESITSPRASGCLRAARARLPTGAAMPPAAGFCEGKSIGGGADLSPCPGETWTGPRQTWRVSRSHKADFARDWHAACNKACSEEEEPAEYQRTGDRLAYGTTEPRRAGETLRTDSLPEDSLPPQPWAGRDGRPA
jgi:hypothetical protein